LIDHINRIGQVFYEKEEDSGAGMKKGWEVKKLEDVVDFQRGLTYSKKDEVGFSDNVVLRSNNVDLAKNILDLTELKYINPAIEIPKNKKVKKGSLIICTANGSKSHLGKIALINDDYNFAFGGFMGMITPKEKLDSSFLFYLMTSHFYKKFISELSDGANINNLKFGDLGQFEIPLPPLPEQKRIVAILDEAFAAIDKAKANAEKNLANAKELFESYLNGIFANPGEDWEEKRLGEITLKIGSGATPLGGQKAYKHQGISLIRSLNIHDDEFKYDDLAFIDEVQATKLSNVSIEPRDVLLNITGASIARCNIVPDNVLPARVNQHVSIIRLKTDVLLPEFLYYMLISKPHKNKLLYSGEKNGATRQALTKSLIENYKVSYPDIKIQKEIIKKINAVKYESILLKKIYQQKIVALDELKKSILKKAFEGAF
jgi:type I restriction enzyme S subunit